MSFQNKVKIAPSIAAGNLARLADCLEEAEKGGADMIHLDVADGHFAPNITFGAGTIKCLREISSLYFDTHLMITDPVGYIDSFIEAGSNTITAHFEVLNKERIRYLSSHLREKKVKFGIAFKPETDIPKWILDNSELFDVFLIMTVNPGFSGQKLIPSVLPKISMLSSFLKEKNLNCEIEVDGGIEPDNAAQLVKLGATILVAGASVFRRKNVGEAIKELKDKASTTLVLK